MKTECTPPQLEFHALGRRAVVGKFDGGNITSDAGGLLLRETEKRTRIISGFAKCFEDKRNQEAIEHTVEALIAQRVYALAYGEILSRQSNAHFCAALSWNCGPVSDNFRQRDLRIREAEDPKSPFLV